MSNTATRPKSGVVETPSGRLLRSAVEQSHEIADLTAKLSDRELVLVFKTSTNAFDRNKVAHALAELSEAFARAATVLQTRQSKRILSVARQQVDTVRAGVIARKEAIPSAEITGALGITRQALSKAVQANRLFSMDVGGERYYPAFFADPKLERRKVERVSKTLGDLSGWEKWVFFTTPKLPLGRKTPLDALREGRYKDVMRAAAGAVER